MKYKGSTFLKVMGILCIIFGALGIISGVVSLGSASLLSSFGISSGAINGSLVIGLVSGIIMLIAGILGCTNSRKPEKAGANVAFGFIMIILSIISIVLSMKVASDTAALMESFGVAGGGVKSVGFMSILNLIIPILYLIPALQLKKGQPAA